MPMRPWKMSNNHLQHFSCELIHQHPDLLQPELQVPEGGSSALLPLGLMLQTRNGKEQGVIDPVKELQTRGVFHA